MSAHAINKQAFEFTCQTEEAAKNVQQEIENYTALQINDIISSILSGYPEKETYYKIDQIEIDLGDIPLKDFGRIGMLDKFRKIFSEKISNIQYGRKDPDYIIPEEYSATVSAAENDFEIVKSFILHGDMPWWSNKNNDIQFDEVLQKLIRTRPEPLKSFLKEHGSHLDALFRILEYSKPETISMMNALIPDINPASVYKKFFQEESNFASSLFSPEQLTKLRKIFAKRSDTSIDAHKVLLRKLVRLNKLFRSKGLLLSVVSPRSSILKIGSLKISGERIGRKTGGEIRNFIGELTVFQMEFLLFQLSLFSEEELTDNKVHHLEKFFSNAQGYTFLFSGAEKIETQGGRENAFSEETLLNTGSPFISGDTKNKPDQIADSSLVPAEDDVNKSNLLKSDIDPGEQDNTNKVLFPGAKKSTEEIETPGEDAKFVPVATDKTDQIPGESAIAAAKDNELPNDVADSDQINKANKEFLSDAKKNEDEISHADHAVTIAIPGGDKIHDDKANKFSDVISAEKEKYEDIDLLPDFSTYAAKRKISFIMKRLNTDDPILLQYLKQREEKDLDNLVKSFKQHIHRKIKFKKLINDLLEHPYFLKYNLLKIYAGISTDKMFEEKKEFQYPGEKRIPDKKTTPVHPNKEIDDKKEMVIAELAKKIQFSQASFFAIVNKLSLKELIILKDIFQKERFDTNNEKKIVRKLLSKLPEDGIYLVQFLTALTEKEIQDLLFFNSETFAGNTGLDKKADIFHGDVQPEKIYIENAGLCLIAVYLPNLFKHLGYLEDKLFKNRALATRALYLLQYIATGKNKSPEYLLQFNKLLCGIHVDDYITGGIRLTKKEISEADDLLRSVIDNWKTLKNTSLQGFRESFLQRKGILFENELSWTLQAERKGYDLLLNTIPWGFGIIKLPWMKKHIQVEW